MSKQTKKKGGKTWVELVREVFPDATDDEADYILWEHTGFPSFWNIPEEGETPEECCKFQLELLKERIVDEQRDKLANNH